MERLIIDNRTDKPMCEVLECCKSVVSQGRISNNNTEYCCLTTFYNGVKVWSFKNKKSDRLLVLPHKTKKK
jgi:hypothetical protein